MLQAKNRVSFVTYDIGDVEDFGNELAKPEDLANQLVKCEGGGQLPQLLGRYVPQQNQQVGP